MALAHKLLHCKTALTPVQFQMTGAMDLTCAPVKGDLVRFCLSLTLHVTATVPLNTLLALNVPGLHDARPGQADAYSQSKPSEGPCRVTH